MIPRVQRPHWREPARVRAHLLPLLLSAPLPAIQPLVRRER